MGQALLAELGLANVVVRGVLHVLNEEHRRRTASTLHTVLDGRGSLLLLETNWRGDMLEYLEYLGGRNGRLPDPLARLIDRRLPAPCSFGPAQLAETFPSGAWTTIVSGATRIEPVRVLGNTAGQTIPGFFAVLTPARRTTAANQLPS